MTDVERLRAVAKLHHAIEIKVLAADCFGEDCDHDDSEGCDEAKVAMMCCAHCSEIRELTAFQEDGDYCVEPWPCPTAKAAQFDGCQHTEHAIRPGFGRVGRYFEGLNDQAGKWERCPARNDGQADG